MTILTLNYRVNEKNGVDNSWLDGADKHSVNTEEVTIRTFTVENLKITFLQGEYYLLNNDKKILLQHKDQLHFPNFVLEVSLENNEASLQEESLNEHCHQMLFSESVGYEVMPQVGDLVEKIEDSKEFVLNDFFVPESKKTQVETFTLFEMREEPSEDEKAEGNILKQLDNL